MVRDRPAGPELADARRLVAGFLDGTVPSGVEFDAWRRLVREDPAAEIARIALTNVLEGALADPTLPIDDAQRLVPLLKSLARGDVTVGELL